MVNKVILIGNVGADPDVRYLEGGTAVANLRLATTERYKNKNGENIDQTEWHNIVLWRGLAEIVEKYVHKGVNGMKRKWKRKTIWAYLDGEKLDDQNGNKRYTTEIWADNMQMLSYKQEGDNTGAVPRSFNTPANPEPAAPAAASLAPDDSDDLPF